MINVIQPSLSYCCAFADRLQALKGGYKSSQPRAGIDPKGNSLRGTASRKIGGENNSPHLLAVARRATRAAFNAVAICLTVVLGLSSVRATAAIQFGTTDAPAASVDPLIGTGRGPGGKENLFPGPSMPFGMVQLSPDTESYGFGYHYYQPAIQCFSMDHMSGPGGSNEGNVCFTATTGPVQTALAGFESPYSHRHESAAPGYYQVRLSRWGVNAEFTATERTGLARFTFPAGKAANILLPVSHSLYHTLAAQLQVAGNQEIAGYVENRIWSGKPYKVFFVMTFSRPFASFGTWHGNAGGAGQIAVGSRTVVQVRPGQWVGAYVRWPAAAHPQSVTVKIGISYVDLAGAENNLKAEAAGKDFDQVRQEAWTAWNRELSVIAVSGGAARDRRVFYTALYHSLLMPSIFSDADGRYVGYDDKIHTIAPGHLIYCNYSGWDIYRSQMPLLALIEPRRMEDMANSMVLMYEQGGWIGRWPSLNGYTGSMSGSPLTVVLCMDWLEGLRGFDIGKAWQGMMLDATQAPPPGAPYFGESGIEWINTVHFVPSHAVQNRRFWHESVSQIQEDCIAYASLYRLAVELGKTPDAKMLYQRALYYRNVFNPQDRFFRPRHADGSWLKDFDPAQDAHDADGFSEGSGWHYQWLAPCDLAWLGFFYASNLSHDRTPGIIPGWMIPLSR